MNFIKSKKSGSERRRILYWSVIVAGCLVLSLVRTFDPHVQIHQNSDSITHSLASFDVWSPYFYGQDRLGMLFSLLGAWISDPVDNLLFLNFLFISFVFLLLSLWGFWLTRTESGIYGGILAGVFYILAGRGRAVFVSSVEHPEYVGALMLGFAGMVILDRVRQLELSKKVIVYEALAGVFLVLASWVNITVPIFLGGFYVLRWMYYRTRWQYLCYRVGLLMAAFLLVLIITKITVSSGVKTSVSLVGLEQWWLNFQRLISNSYHEFYNYWFFAGIGGLCLIVLTIVRSDKYKVPLSTLVCYTGGLGFLGFLALVEHVGTDGHGECRSCYSVPTVFAFLLGGGITVQRVIELCKVRNALPFTVSGACIYVLIFTGLPSKNKVLNEYEVRWGRWRDLLIAHECTHIGGNSWFTYDVMFYTNYTYYVEGSDQRIFPYTFRDSPYSEAALKAVNETSTIGVCVHYDWHDDPLHLQTRDDEVHVNPNDLSNEEGFQLHEIRKAKTQK